MLYSRRDQLAVLDHSLEHLRHRMLTKDTLLLAFNGKLNVDCAALRCRNLNAEAVLRKVDGTRVRRIELNHGSGASNLQLERRRVGYRDRGDHGLDKHAGLRAVHYGNPIVLFSVS